MENKRIIFTNDYCETHSDEAIAEKQVQWYEEYGEVINEEKALELIDDDLEMWFEDELHELKAFFGGEYYHYLAIGSVGRWNGTFAAGTIFGCDEFESVLWKMLRDCMEYTIKDVNGILQIESAHHDGCVSFEIKGITDKGEAYYDRWSENWNDQRTESEIHQKMWNDSHYTHVLHFADKVYGKITKHKQKKSVPAMA